MHFGRIKGGYGRVTGILLYNHGLIRLLAQREMTMTMTMVVENQIVFKNIQKKFITFYPLQFVLTSAVAQNHHLLSYTQADQPLSGYQLHFDQKQLVYRTQR